MEYIKVLSKIILHLLQDLALSVSSSGPVAGGPPEV